MIALREAWSLANGCSVVRIHGEHGEELVLVAISPPPILFRFFLVRPSAWFAFCDFENGAEESRRRGIVEQDASLVPQANVSRELQRAGRILEFRSDTTARTSKPRARPRE